MTRSLAALTILGILATGTAEAREARALPRWIAGCWAGERGPTRFEERWVAADPATMLGVSYTLKGGKVTAFEFLRIVVQDARVVYIAQPGGRPPTEFSSPQSTDNEVSFENPAHDFPKRVAYKLVDGNHLLAWIDGGPSAPDKRVEYPLSRVACGTP